MLKYKILNKLFGTDLKRKTLEEVTISDLKSLGVTTIGVDADNTTSFDGTIEPLPYSNSWIRNAEENGFKVLLLSNAKLERAEALAKKYNIPCVGLALKPLPFGYIRACIKAHERPSKICMIGDQLFTDIMGANLFGYKTIYVYPYKKEERNVESYEKRRAKEKKIFAYLDRKN